MISDKALQTRQQLLDAAATVFSERGYARATTKEIAKTAGVAEGTIYRHFSDKRELFQAVFAEQNAISTLGAADLSGLVGTATVRENLQRLVKVIEDVEEVVAPLQASLWSDAELMDALAGSMASSPAGSQAPSFLEPLARYLEAEQNLGRIKPGIDTERAAFALFAIPFAAVMTARMARGTGTGEVPDIAGALDILLEGLEP